MRVNEQYLGIVSIILSTFMIISCLNEPEYVTIKKTEFPKPFDLNIVQNDAFSLTVAWLISKELHTPITSFKIETFALDSQVTISNTEFSNFMRDIPNARQTIINNDELSFNLNSSQDTLEYSYIDTGSFNANNYYRVTVLSDGIISYSHYTDQGIMFEIGAPKGFKVSQISDYQLSLAWDNELFSDGYELFRYDSLDHLDTSFIIADTFLLDSSFNPRIFSNEIDINYFAEGMVPNEVYKYSVWAFSNMGAQRRYSHVGSTLEGITLKLLQPRIKVTRPQNSHTTRLYIESSSIDTYFDSIFVFKYNSALENWEVLDTGIVLNMKAMIDKDLERCHVIDIPNSSESIFTILAKGKINALFSNDTIGDVFPFHNYERIEGGYFGTTSQWIDSFYLSSIEYVAQVALIDKSISNEILTETQIFPSDSISWVEAVMLCDQFSQTTGYEIRLPSELEWEYAALKDVFSDNNSWLFDYPWGSNMISGEYANYMNSGDLWDNSLTPVGHYNGKDGTYDNSSSFGVYDLAGNVLEWCGSGSRATDMNSIELSDSSIIGDPIRDLRGGGYWHEVGLLKSNLPEEFKYSGNLAALGLGFRVLIQESD